ncbi:hypothetical protein [Jongsikchunia kroppenstedtii]|uniref:hypothetical protein n=1 Tax=Jongsikchunia kroppenstedtii TaxID=1121721 RepID=UPI0012DCECE6|nr:hypothetical protein [Jongsikchunia kroppenstedtii]
MTSNHDTPDHDDQLDADTSDRTDPTTNDVTDDDEAKKSSPATEQVHYERAREQQKIDDFNNDRDPRRQD